MRNLTHLLVRRPRYRWRLRARSRLLPWLDRVIHPEASDARNRIHALAYATCGRLVARGRRDCRDHVWFNANHVVENCYYCDAGIRPIRAESRDHRGEAICLAELLMQAQPEIRAWVGRRLATIGSSPRAKAGEDLIVILVLASQLGGADLVIERAREQHKLDRERP